MTIESPTVSVAMATYNGERFLQEQLDSLAAQTHLPCELVVGDDGSTDGTLDILERFARTAPFPVHIQRNSVNLGYGENFLQTASRCTGEWIAFCDQDDVWKPTKLAIFCRVLKRHPQVSLFVHELTECDEHLRHLMSVAAGFWISRTVSPLKGAYRVFAGCSMIFRKTLLDIFATAYGKEFVSAGAILGHDSVINLSAYCTSFRYECRHALVLHRRHAAAATSGYSNKHLDRLRRVRSTTCAYFWGARNTYLFIGRWFRDHAKHTNELHQYVILTAARLFEKKAQLYERRGELYAASDIIKRAQIFSRLIVDRDYLTELTSRDHVKDLLRVFVAGNAPPARYDPEGT